MNLQKQGTSLVVAGSSAIINRVCWGDKLRIALRSNIIGSGHRNPDTFNMEFGADNLFDTSKDRHIK